MRTALSNSLLAIEDTALGCLISSIGALTEKMSAKQIKAAMDAYDAKGEDPEKKPYKIKGGVAVIKLSGAMQKHSSWMMEWLGGVSTDSAKDAIKEACDDSAVDSILLKWESPGGSIDGTADLAHTIRMGCESKPIWSYNDGQMCSAACWAGSQANQVWSGETAMNASIGVITAIADQSEVFKGTGIKIHKIATGPLKGIGMYYSPVTKEQLAVMQGMVDDIGAIMVRDINEARGTSLVLGEGLASGQSCLAAEAKDAGIIDGIAPFESVLAMMQRGVGMGPAVARSPRSAEATEVETLFNAIDTLMKNQGAESSDSAHKEVRMTDETKKAGLKAFLAELGLKLGLGKDESDTAATTEAPSVSGDAGEGSGLTVTVLASEFDALKAESAKVAELTALLAENVETFKAMADAAGTAETTDVFAIIHDGVQARKDEVAAFAEEMNRVLGSGTVTSETLLAKMKGKSLAEIKADAAPYVKKASEMFAAQPENPEATGQATRSGEDADEAEVAAAAAAGDTERAKAAFERLSKSGMYNLG